ncbi:hypothetical protein [Streptomyces sp. NPDC048669]|uniref:hypothetical protein n=1 Tax=Streptomyces sp. NPDC048669 TaxID=3155267 RepID=UPI0034468E54
MGYLGLLPPKRTEDEAHPAELATTRKVIAELAPTGAESEPPESPTAYQAILNAFNTHPDQAFRVRELHELFGMPTEDPAMSVTRSRLGRLTRQGSLTQRSLSPFLAAAWSGLGEEALASEASEASAGDVDRCLDGGHVE